ncbi:hypothetical protein TIFTF001_030830 [Ficus carica]|uniref:Uncharacterized protein n=1 Tax=Ficus carica TaxID=3494 RepID=A0AA88J4B3_FICCA|nr:hypothetical protein TIFTF001_030830 [Ficus carica]
MVKALRGCMNGFHLIRKFFTNSGHIALLDQGIGDSAIIVIQSDGVGHELPAPAPTPRKIPPASSMPWPETSTIVFSLPYVSLSLLSLSIFWADTTEFCEVWGGTMELLCLGRHGDLD